MPKRKRSTAAATDELASEERQSKGGRCCKVCIAWYEFLPATQSLLVFNDRPSSDVGIEIEHAPQILWLHKSVIEREGSVLNAQLSSRWMKSTGEKPIIKISECTLIDVLQDAASGWKVWWQYFALLYGMVLHFEDNMMLNQVRKTLELPEALALLKLCDYLSDLNAMRVILHSMNSYSHVFYTEENDSAHTLCSALRRVDKSNYPNLIKWLSLNIEASKLNEDMLDIAIYSVAHFKDVQIIALALVVWEDTIFCRNRFNEDKHLLDKLFIDYRTFLDSECSGNFGYAHLKAFSLNPLDRLTLHLGEDIEQYFISPWKKIHLAPITAVEAVYESIDHFFNFFFNDLPSHMKRDLDIIGSVPVMFAFKYACYLPVLRVLYDYADMNIVINGTSPEKTLDALLKSAGYSYGVPRCTEFVKVEKQERSMKVIELTMTKHPLCEKKPFKITLLYSTSEEHRHKDMHFTTYQLVLHSPVNVTRAYYSISQRSIFMLPSAAISWKHRIVGHTRNPEKDLTKVYNSVIKYYDRGFGATKCATSSKRRLIECIAK